MAARMWGEIGMRLSHHRRRLNISVEEMSEYLGVLPEQIYRYKRGYELPKEEMLMISEKFNIHYNKLIFGRDGKPQ